MSRSACAAALTAFLIPAIGFAGFQSRYDREYPVIGYEASEPADAVARLKHRIDAGELTLDFEEDNGYLPALLEALGIDVSSQMLVFSKTSLQVSRISPATPRAIYFNDSTYVASVRGGPIEISSVDPRLGIVFYTLDQSSSPSPDGVAAAGPVPRRNGAAPPRFERATIRCLECHDSYSLTGGGVPRHLVGSGLIAPTGDLASHEGWFLTTDQTPLRRRWGGWYVTGTHGTQVHRGNLMIRDAAHARSLDLAATGNVTELDSLVSTDPYLGEHSDIVALLVLEHQTSVQNVITRVSWDTRMALYDERAANRAAGRDESLVSDATRRRIAEIAEPLVGALLMVGQPKLSAPIAGTSGFRAHFESLGPDDRQGRSLRQLDLVHRLFRYPLSYVIYSEAFDALPVLSKARAYQRLDDVLSGRDTSSDFDHLAAADRAAILEILAETKPEFGNQRR